MNKNKIKLVGNLLAQKLDFSFIGYSENNGCIDFNFVNKEGFKRCYATEYRRIIKYCTYTNTNIMKVLFDM